MLDVLLPGRKERRAQIEELQRQQGSAERRLLREAQASSAKPSPYSMIPEEYLQGGIRKIRAFCQKNNLTILKELSREIVVDRHGIAQDDPRVANTMRVSVASHLVRNIYARKLTEGIVLECLKKSSSYEGFTRRLFDLLQAESRRKS